MKRKRPAHDFADPANPNPLSHSSVDSYYLYNFFHRCNLQDNKPRREVYQTSPRTHHIEHDCCNAPIFCPGSPKRNWPRHLKTKQEILNMILCIINQEKWNRIHLCVHACVCVYVCAHVYALWQSITHKPIKVYI